tara:strand:- start:1871 stop:2521 length:651 start_codon:yes stop_codon:yes gene_type:complete
MSSWGITASIVIGLIIYSVYRLRRKTRQQQFIENFVFPQSVSQKVKKTYPHLGDKELRLVMLGLREYFVICNKAGRNMVAMPSQVVDVAWHEFILFTRKYQAFCDKAFGRYLHHTPAEAMPDPKLATEGIKRAWRLACARERIKAFEPTRLPLLFALDRQLNIEGGFTYALDCTKGGGDYCASHIGCTSSCSGDSGHDSDSGCSGDSGCGGGCGGD